VWEAQDWWPLLLQVVMDKVVLASVVAQLGNSGKFKLGWNASWVWVAFQVDWRRMVGWRS
jgi:hypothetical protein